MEILADSFPTEWGEIRKASERLKISTDELKQAGGNETAIPKKFARGDRSGWDMWGNQADETYEPTWKTYANHTVAAKSTRTNLQVFFPVRCGHMLLGDSHD